MLEEKGKVRAWLKDYITAIRVGQPGGFTAIQREARAATNKDPWGPMGVQLNRLASETHNEQHAWEIFAVLEKRLMSPGERWRNAYKALLVLEFLVMRGHDRCVMNALPLLPLLRCLNNFAYIDTEGKDQGVNVRIRAAAVVAVLEDLDGLGAKRHQLTERMERHYQEWVAAPLSPTQPTATQSEDIHDFQAGSPVAIQRKLTYDGMKNPTIHSSGSSSGPNSAPSNIAAPKPSEAPANYPSNPKATVTVEESKRLNARLSALMARTDNKYCADCKTKDPAAKANWASVNCGVFICINCSGIHRSLGTHISQVRNVGMDTWLPHQVALMEAAGNGPANEYYEALLPRNARAAGGSHAMASFIRDKYANRKWANPETTWPPVAVPSMSKADSQSSKHGSMEASNTHVVVLGKDGPHTAIAGPNQQTTTQGTSTYLTGNVQQDPSSSSASSDTRGPTMGCLLPLSDDDDTTSVTSMLRDGGSVASCNNMLVDPSLGVMEWLDAQYMGGQRMPFMVTMPGGSQSPVVPGQGHVPGGYSPSRASTSSPAGNMSHVIMSPAGASPWVPGYVPPRPSNPPTPLQTPLNRSAVYPGGMLAATGRGFPGTISMLQVPPHMHGAAATMPPHMLAYAAQQVMMNGGAMPHYIPHSQAAVAAHRAAFAAMWDQCDIDDGTVANALDELASTTRSNGDAAHSPYSPRQTSSHHSSPSVIAKSQPRIESVTPRQEREPTALPCNSNTGASRLSQRSVSHSATTHDPIDVLPSHLPPPQTAVPYRGEDPFRASVINQSPMRGSRVNSTAGSAPHSPALKRPGLPSHGSSVSLQDLMNGAVSDLDASLRPSRPGSGYASPATCLSPRQPEDTRVVPADPNVMQQARSRLAAAGIVKPASMRPATSMGIAAQQSVNSMRVMQEGSLTQAMVKGYWNPLEGHNQL